MLIWKNLFSAHRTVDEKDQTNQTLEKLLFNVRCSAEVGIISVFLNVKKFYCSRSYFAFRFPV